MANVAFIGLGNMGGPMAKNLIKAGHQVTVFDLMPAACADLEAAGAAVAASATEAASGKDYVISMLPAGKHVAATYLGDDGLLAQLDASTTCLDCSTIDAATAREVGEAAAAAGIGFMDTPVSGGVAAAAAGTLAFMCGGSADTFPRAQAILSAMGKNIFHAGPAGAGQVAKGCNNMLLAIHMIGSAEALEMGARNGLDPAVLSEIMLASSGRNWSLEVYNPYPGVMETAPASNDYQPGFMTDLMVKDLGLALEIAEQSGVDNQMGKLARALYGKHQEEGNGQRDFSSILEQLKG
ncbi:3-hydroxyisobutyrate dehydrogenase [Halioglobus japonicus]|uniref:3-hydroxyisobutyrate dehydrogenase n=1 Tax=Halioglobus japonicus TaxID=930805 RepID=A0AAP8SP96_9GAMM|nr:3-hydroxyisobutyrate dehydrogenase [Halioglobus japonicus]AQA19599.1 3-hydroxyisobutyrate dehydrogenase [Halioglobus japonicus]PLW87331.1 3-hydroxyisobutyrate dehydrogenase [Halioglobus japonicus]GHD08982.1 3-hydroxyisobutyrate dehydrogenase [Halioglobus japonicus]